MKKSLIAILFSIATSTSMEGSDLSEYSENYSKSIKLYKKALAFVKEDKVDKALPILEAAANLGHVGAPYELMMYHYRLMGGNLGIVTFQMASECSDFDKGDRWNDIFNRNLGKWKLFGQKKLFITNLPFLPPYP